MRKPFHRDVSRFFETVVWNLYNRVRKTMAPSILAEAPASSEERGDGLQALAGRFDEQKEILLSVSGDTEHEFVAFGQEAGALSREAKDILELVNGILETATGENARQAIDLFEELVTNAERLIAADESEIRGLIEEMSCVRRNMSSLLQHRLKMDQSVRLPLFLLKVGFRVEGAHTNARLEKILNSVALDITVLREKLTHCTEDQFRGLEVASRSMEALVETLSKMSEEARLQYGEAGARIKELLRHASQLRDARLSEDEIAQRINANGRALHEQFNRIIMALQYHDITRQQLEHVGQAFETMREWLPAGGPREAPQASSKPALLHQASGLQIEQTESTLQSLRAAGREFLESMEANARYAGDLASDVSVFSSLCRNEQVFRALDGLSALQSFIVARSGIKRDVGEAACLIYGKVTDCTQQIRELTFDLRLLAINAQVQAANAGQDQVIEVLAENICRVSETIQEEAQSLAMEMDSIMKEISGLVTHAWVLGTQQTQEGRAVSEGVPRCVASLQELQTSVGTGLESIIRRQAEFQQRIHLLLSRVHFPELASQRLQTVLSFFQEIQAQTRPVGGGSNVNHEALAGFKSSYTMASERQIHATVVERESARDGAVAGFATDGVELFDAAPMAEPGIQDSKTETAPDEPFGDNIELF